MNTDTPETDGIVEQCYRQINVPTNPIPADFARKLERERDELRSAIRNLRDVKGRHHTEQAATKLFNLIP